MFIRSLRLLFSMETTQSWTGRESCFEVCIIPNESSAFKLSSFIVILKKPTAVTCPSLLCHPCSPEAGMTSDHLAHSKNVLCLRSCFESGQRWMCAVGFLTVGITAVGSLWAYCFPPNPQNWVESAVSACTVGAFQ